MIERTSAFPSASSDSTLDFASDAILSQSEGLESSERTIDIWWKKIKVWIVYRLEMMQFQHQVKKERQTLQALPDELLRDIGINRGDANCECRRPISDVPTDRLDAPRLRDE